MSRTEAGRPPRIDESAAAEQAADAVRLRMAQWAFALVCLAVAGRVLAGDIFLNHYYPYTLEGGSLIGKIHPSNYLLGLAASIMYLGPGFRFRASDLPIVRAALILGFVVLAIGALNVAQGQFNSAGFVVDTYLGTIVGLMILLAMPYGWREIAGMLVLGVLAFNSVIAMGEFAAGRYVFSATVPPAEFRPAGLLGYALNVGVINMTAAILLASLHAPALLRIAAGCLFLVAVFISGSRAALMVGAVLLPVVMVATAHLRKQGPSGGVTFVILALAAIAASPLIYVAASEFGLLARFADGVLDDSARTRLDIYQVFSHASWRDLMLGGDVNLVRQLALERYGIQHIESPIVTFVFVFGLPMTIFFVASLVWLLARIGYRAHPAIGLAMLAFLVVALTNNTLSTKTPVFFIVIILAIGARAHHDRVHAHTVSAAARR